MQAFISHIGGVLPLDISNVDTDAIIPKQYLKSIKRSGFGDNLFDSWRYLDEGTLGQDHTKRRKNPDSIINDPRYLGTSILLTRSNFGCGSSREHAVWALTDAGFRVVLASSFSDIFYSNCINNGLLPIIFKAEDIDEIFQRVYVIPDYKLAINLPKQSVTDDTRTWAFEINALSKRILVEGLDSIALTLLYSDKITAFEEERKRKAPWLFSRIAK